VAAVKKAVAAGILPGDPLHPEALFASGLLKDVLKGHARMFTPPTTAKKSISAPFSLNDFHHLVDTYQRTWSGPPAYKDALVLGGMAIGLGGCLRPGEYLKTNALQRTEALLSLDQIRFHLTDPSIKAPLSGIDFYRLIQRSGPHCLRSIHIQLRCGKTDQNKTGHTVQITDPLCMSLVSQYLSARPFTDDAGQPLTALLIDKSGRIPQQCTAIRFTSYMRKFLTRHGVHNAPDFTLKSLRSGAAESIADGQARAIAIAAKGRWSSFNTPARHYLNRRTSK